MQNPRSRRLPRQRFPVRPIAAGYNSSQNPLLLQPGETPDCLNVEFDGGSVKNASGVIKFNNQVAPTSALECRPDDGLAPITVWKNKSVPSRGYIYIPYDERQDIGADLARIDYDATGEGGSGDFPTFHTQRGKSFDLQSSFRLPEDERLYEGGHVGELYDPTADYTPLLGGEIAVDEFTAIVQKGGDRMQPMSWALGIVNVGELPDIPIRANGTNVLEFDPALHAERPSNYGICFMWLDAPKYGEQFPSQMRYRTGGGKVYADDQTHYDDALYGKYCTMALRSVFVPAWIEPGKNYTISFQVSLDSGTIGTGAEPTSSWNEDGVIRCHVMEDGGSVQTFEYSAADPSSKTIYRYKGPSDTLGYLAKYGVRYHGRDPMYLGLGYRMAPWSSAGFMPYGKDSAPIENGGFQITDESAVTTQALTCAVDPLNDSGTPIVPFLRLAHDSAQDPGGTLIEVSDAGLVYNAGSYAAMTWGEETGLYGGLSPFGRSPLGYRDGWHVGSSAKLGWMGLRGVSGSAFGQAGINSEALRGYRFVLDPLGFGGAGKLCGGGLLSIKEYVAAQAYATTTYNYHVVLEGSYSSWGGTATFTGNDYRAGIRAFRWNQRPTVISDFRVYMDPRDFTDPRVELDAKRHTNLSDTGGASKEGLVGVWPLSESDDGELLDLVLGNHALRAPFSLTQTSKGTRGSHELFLSGEGESLYLDLGENPSFKGLLDDAGKNGSSGFAVEITCRIPEAAYSIPLMVEDTGDPTTDRWGSIGQAPIISLETRDSDGGRIAPLLQMGQDIQLTGYSKGSTAATVTGSPWAGPLAFDMKMPTDADYQAHRLYVPHADLESWSWDGADISPRWDSAASWVGQTITIQVGVESTSTPDEFTAYIAATPASSLIGSGQGQNAEFALKASVTLDKRSLERAVLSVGGVLLGGSGRLLERSARILVDEVRWYGATAPGSLPSTSGELAPEGDGKILGGNAHPPVELEASDLLVPLNGTGATIDLEHGSAGAIASTGVTFTSKDPRRDIRSALRSFIQISGNVEVVPQKSTIWEEHKVHHFVELVTTNALTFSRPYTGSTRAGASAGTFRVVGYTSLGDDLTDRSVVISGSESLSSALFANPSPGTVGWRIRTTSGSVGKRPRDIYPRWVRGMKAGDDRPILGLSSMNTQLFAGAQGALFEVDDRWRADGPTDALQNSLVFLSQRGAYGVNYPLARDWVSKAGNDADLSTVMLQGTGHMAVFDAWVKLKAAAGIQTVAWYGNGELPLAQWWIRLSDGYPELVVGSTDTAASTSATPTNGLYVSRGAARVPAGEWVHLRWYLSIDNSTDRNIQLPELAINGRPVEVRVSDTGSSAAAGAWLDLDTLRDGGTAATGALIMGSAHARYRAGGDVGYTAVVPVVSEGGTDPTVVSGMIHTLNGQLGQFAVHSQLVGAEEIEPGTSFVPQAITYGAQMYGVNRFDFGEGVGHRTEDGEGGYAEICSSPFLSLDHEMGRGTEPFIFANYGSETYVANGSRPRIIEDGQARMAGIMPPASKPSFSIERQPIWKEQQFVSSGHPENDPLGQKDTTDPSNTIRLYKYRLPGTACIVHPLDNTFLWELDDYFAFKCYVKPNSVTGRIPLFSRRGSVDSGAIFVEIRDGKCVVGWWDTTLKKEVFISTNKAVFQPGYWHYVYVRKFYPRSGQAPAGRVGQGSLASSNWQNSIFDIDYQVGNEGACMDSMIVRRFRKADIANYFSDYTGFDATPRSSSFGYAAASSSSRACVSFTVDETDWTALGSGHTVTLKGLVAAFTVNSAATTGSTVTITGTGNQRFLLDHVGMLCQFTQAGASGDLTGKVYRISWVPSTTTATLYEEDGTPANITANHAGGQLVISPDVWLEKSAEFDESLKPDPQPYACEVFGSSLTGDPLQGLKPFDGEGSCFAFVIAGGEDYGGFGNGKYGSPNLFEDSGVEFAAGTIVSGAEIGTDEFGDNAGSFGHPYEGVPAQRLACEANMAFVAVDTRGYGGASSAASTSAPGTVVSGDPTINVGVSASTSTTNCIVYSLGLAVVVGERRILITFYDPQNDVESFPNVDGVDPDPLIVKPGDEDPTNPSGSLELVLSQWAKPIEDRPLYVRVYMTEAAGAAYFRAAEIQDPLAESVSIKLDDVSLLSAGVLNLDTGAPPRARMVASLGNVLLYGGLKGFEDGIAYSYPNFPEDVAPTSVIPFATGEGAGITGLAQLGGRGIVFKRNAVYSLAWTAEAGLSFATVTAGDGCVGPDAIATLEDRVYYVSDRGPMLLVPSQTPSGLQAYSMGTRVQPYFRDEVDQRYLSSISATTNRQRNQFVFTLKGSGRLLPDERMSLEFDHPLRGPAQVNELVAGHRYSRYRAPAVVSLASVQSRDGGVSRMVGGTQDGFVVWMDDDRTSRSMLGPGDAWGDSLLTTDGAGAVTGSVDMSLEGPRGSVVRWFANGQENEAYVLAAYESGGSTYLVVRGSSSALLQAPAGAVTVGQQLYRFTSFVFDAQATDLEKRIDFLDVSRSADSSGTLQMDCFRNLEPDVEGTRTITLSDSFSTEEVGSILQESRVAAFLFRNQTPEVDDEFELLDIVVTFHLTENR
jgi:hypothetical protein